MKLKKDINIAKDSNALIAGLLIGLGVIINVQTEPAILGALLFSFGLLTIIQLKLPLYTGRIGFLSPRLVFILLWNLIGVGFITILYFYSNPDFYNLLLEASINKFDKSYLHFLIGGIFCGILIHFAVKCKVSYLTSMAVIIFILIGAEHCIADFPYLLINFSFINIIKLILVIIGNSIGAIFIERMVTNE